MKENVLKKYALEIVLLIVLFFTLFVSKTFPRILLAIILTIYMVFVLKLLKKRRILSISHKQVSLLMAILGALYLMIFYLMGLFFGYYNATVKFSGWSLVNYIIPITFITISTEVMRNIFLARDSKASMIISTICMVIIDLVLYTNIYDITTFDGFLAIVGFTLFASISCNCLYNYISNRFGAVPIIIFRLITILYVYMIPIIPNVTVFIRCFLRVIYPYLFYLVLEYSYSKNNFVTAYKDKTKDFICRTIFIAILLVIVMIISCDFKYGILVIGSGSMTGTINKGDAIVFEAYNKQKITEGDIIIFNSEDTTRIVHRVINIKLVNGEYHYYTKGDANQLEDENYVTVNQILGIYKFKIPHLGEPTLWLRDMLS